MPVVVQTRPYDEEFYRTIGETPWAEMETAKVLEMSETAKADLGI
jgi:hypothetical protein